MCKFNSLQLLQLSFITDPFKQIGFLPRMMSFPKTSKTNTTSIKLNHVLSCWQQKGRTRGTSQEVQRTVEGEHCPLAQGQGSYDCPCCPPWSFARGITPVLAPEQLHSTT